jgi:protein SCO1/2
LKHPSTHRPAFAALSLGLLVVMTHGAARAEAPQPPALRNAKVVEHLGEKVPLDLTFADENGKTVKLEQYLNKGKPVILNLVYFSCPMLCSYVQNGMLKSLKMSGWKLGKDVDILTVSIDHKDTPAKANLRRIHHLQSIGLPPTAQGWSFLTGQRKNLDALAAAVGFGFTYDEATGQYAHAAALMILSETGKLSRYLYGVGWDPRELRLALAEASEGRSGPSFDRVLLQCFRYDPAARKYKFFMSAFLRGGGALVLLVLSGMLVHFWRRELRGQSGPKASLETASREPLQ